MKKQNKNRLIATLAIITTMVISMAGNSFGGTSDLGDGGHGGCNFEIEIDEPETPDEPNKTITINLTNTHSTETVIVKGTKTWVDDNNRDGLRPAEIVIHLYADGEDTGLTATANEASNWTYEFSDLAKYENGKAIEYSIKEDTIEGYSVKYEFVKTE